MSNQLYKKLPIHQRESRRFLNSVNPKNGRKEEEESKRERKVNKTHFRVENKMLYLKQKVLITINVKCD